jgi:hypothetical protein
MNQPDIGPNPYLKPKVEGKPKTKLSEILALSFLALVGLAMAGAWVYSKFDDAARDNTFKVKSGECLHLDTMATSIQRCGSEPGLVKVLHVYKAGNSNTTGGCKGEVITTSKMFSDGPGDSYCVAAE